MTLTGDSGVLTQTNTAKERTQIEAVKEKAKTDIYGLQAQKENANITQEELKTILEQYFKEVPEEFPEDLSQLELITKEEYGQYKIKVSEIWNGKLIFSPPVFNPDKLTIGDAINSEKYGWKVTGYDVKKEEVGNWRLFYQDKKHTYLISNNSVGKVLMSGENLPDNRVGKVGIGLHPMLGPSLENAPTDYMSIRSIAWATDISENGPWSKYKNEDAFFCIGSPTVELFVKSYNAQGEGQPLGLTIAAGVGGYETLHITGRHDQITGDICNGLYNNGTNWCLSSPPSSHYNYGLRGMLAWRNDIMDSGVYFNYSPGAQYPLRPVVCMSTYMFNSKYESTLEQV